MNHFSRFILFPLLCLSLLNACVVRVTPSSNPPSPAPPSAPSGTVINARLNLIAYPGSRILDLDNDRDGSSEVRFTANASLESVNAFFHREISARGWQRTRFELKSNATKIEARYQRQRDDFKYKLDREGNSGRFKLEIDFDDDDDDDDDD
ncbi:MAG: hypothetical protein HC933_14420 [Pleurocapsa sp. SU_196_0]|nr:hypothetical protein [Pleurocapsa sp. SU_196_0]